MKAQRIRLVVTMVCCFVVAGCSVQRALVAQTRQSKIVGLTKEQVLPTWDRQPIA